MSNTVNVSFSNQGMSSHYVVNSTNIAGSLNIASSAILGSTYLTDDVSGGLFDDPLYDIPDSGVATGGYVIPEYQAPTSYHEIYEFTAEGWNNVKNISATASGDDSIRFVADNFVHADIDFAEVTNDVDLRIYDAKRGNYLTGDGNDFIEITSATNDGGWSNMHKIDSGWGNDFVVIGFGDESMIDDTIVNYVDGRFTTVEADLDRGNDTFVSDFFGFKTADFVHGREGNDTIITGEGDDTIWGGEDNGILSQTDTLVYNLIAYGDLLSGGEGADEFIYKTGDGFDYIVDFEDQDVLIIEARPTDTISTEVVTVEDGGIGTTGTLVSINGDASVFLADYTNETDIFV